MRFELLQGLSGVVDEGEAGALATTELRTETEDGDLVLGGAVEAGELLAEFVLGDVGAVGVEDITVIIRIRFCSQIDRTKSASSSLTYPQNDIKDKNRLLQARQGTMTGRPTRPSVSGQAEGCG